MDLAKYLHLLKIIKQCDVFAPQHIGKNDILIGGGKIIAKGTPEEVANNDKSHTGRYLKKVLRRK